MKRFLVFIGFVCAAMISNAQITVSSNGNVGVKDATPASDFTVTGEVRINSPSTVNYGSALRTRVANKDACAYHLWNDYYGQDVFYVSGNGFMWCRLGGYFGSDLNMKQDIRNIQSPLGKVMKLHGVSYRYKDPKGKSAEEEDDRMGLIAQEVEKVVPEVVKEMNDGTKAIAYTDLIGLLVEAMKEQQTQIETLQKQVEKLTSTSKN
jgi:hypothetical protein